MTDKIQQARRAAFEAWTKSEHGDLTSRQDGEYFDDLTHGAWLGLNAAPVQQVVPDASTKMQWPEIVALVNEVLGCEAHKYPCERGSIGHEMTGINFNSLARIIDRVRYAAAPAAPAADAGLVAVELAKDAKEWGPALNKAGWLFLSELNEDPQKSALIFNNCKGPLRAAIMKYAEIVAANRAKGVV